MVDTDVLRGSQVNRLDDYAIVELVDHLNVEMSLHDTVKKYVLGYFTCEVEHYEI